jgi:hypothetical protein
MVTKLWIHSGQLKAKIKGIHDALYMIIERTDYILKPRVRKTFPAVLRMDAPL